MTNLRAPFPWFGGKSRVAPIIWRRFGLVANYVEPFFGSGAVLLGRTDITGSETINDKDHFVANFWRAVQADPAAVATAADWPVNETDLHARHAWLVTEGRQRIAGLEGNPRAYDAEVAGWWVWGLCAWIGRGWCSGAGPWTWGASGWEKGTGAYGVDRTRPHLGNAGQGVNRGTTRQLPQLGNAGRCIHKGGRGPIHDWIHALASRLRYVRVCAGDWSRVVTPCVTTGLGMTAVFLDPPYSDAAGRASDIYSTDDLAVAHAVRDWAIANGSDPLLRICLAGYDGEHAMPADWEAVAWKAGGGYGSQSTGAGRDNAQRERLWFSPACIKPDRVPSLFDILEHAPA